MEMADHLPKPDDLYEHLKQSIQNIHANTEYIDAASYHVEESLRNAKYSLESQESENWCLQLCPFLVFKLSSQRDFSNGNGEARLGANICVRDGSYEMFSSTLLLVINNQLEQGGQNGLNHCCTDYSSADYHILERLHWDIDTGGTESDPKPVCHFQVGGEMSDDAFEEHEEYHYCSNGLDKPRIPHPPMDPILIFNMLIDQYQSLESFNQDRWKRIVSNGERVLWDRYFTTTHGMVNNDETIMNALQFKK